jgi:hypothetical protein
MGCTDMRTGLAIALLMATSGMALAAEPATSFESAKQIWEQTKGQKAYQTYSEEFAQYNNHFRLDEKDGCYALGKEPVELMLIITHRDGGEFAVVERVWSDVDNAKASCFKNSYEGIRTKIPPFFPFTLQMVFN